MANEISDDVLDKLSDSDLHALSKNDLDSLSDEGLALLHGQAQPTWGDRAKQFGHATVNSLPYVGGMVGAALGTPLDAISGPLGTMAGAGLGGMAGTAAKNYINSFIDPDSSPKTMGEGLKSQVLGGMDTAALEGGGQIMGKALEMYGPNLGKYLGSKAEQLAVNSTGATAAQSQKMMPGTGRALLDNNVVRFGRNQEGIANAAGKVLDEQGAKIGNIVDDVTAQNAEKQAALISQRNKLQELVKNDPAQAHIAAPQPEAQSMLPGLSDDLQRTIEKPMQVEVGGQAAKNMRPDSPVYSQDTYLSPLPQAQTDLFNPLNNNPDLTSLAQKMSLDAMTKGEISSLGKQGEILGTELTPRSFAKATVPGVGGEAGQTQMLLDGGTGNTNSYLANLKNQVADLGKQIEGAPGNKQEILDGIQAKITALSGDPAQAQVVKQLEAIKANVAEISPSNPTLAQIEKTKQGFADMVNWTNPEGNAAKAAAQSVYRESGEKMVDAVSPELGSQFKSAKKLWGQMSPVAEAGERRAAQLNQSPLGGVGDMVAYMADGPMGVIGKRVIMPRLASSAAVTTDLISKVLTQTPQALGRFAAPLRAAAIRGPQALAASHYILQQQDEEYRERMKRISDPGADDSQHTPLTNLNEPAQ